MIDEVYEVKSYLNGGVLSERGRYRAAYFVARWFTQEGYDFRETRSAVYDWAKRTGNYIRYDVNDIVTAARACRERLKDNVTVRVSEADINRIVELFDADKVRLLALALLCYAKVHADRDGVFSISVSALSDWLHLSRTSVHSRYLPELATLGYVEKLDAAPVAYHWRKGQEKPTNRYRVTRMKINVPLHNAGGYQLQNNDIRKLYSDIFDGAERSVFTLKGDVS